MWPNVRRNTSMKALVDDQPHWCATAVTGVRSVRRTKAWSRRSWVRRRPGTAQALEVAGLPLEGRHHRGDDDAWNIAAPVLDRAGRGDWPAG